MKRSKGIPGFNLFADIYRPPAAFDCDAPCRAMYGPACQYGDSALFERFPTVDDFAGAEVEEVEKYIKSCGLYKTKAKDIVMMCRKLKEEFGGVVPDTIEELTTLPGIGRKTANLVVGDIYGKPAVVVDTHCIRITSRLGFHNIKDAGKIEKSSGSCCRLRNRTISATGLCCTAARSATQENPDVNSAVCGSSAIRRSGKIRRSGMDTFRNR